MGASKTHFIQYKFKTGDVVFCQWWAELKQEPSKNNFYKTNIWSTRQVHNSNHKPPQTRVFST